MSKFTIQAYGTGRLKIIRKSTKEVYRATLTSDEPLIEEQVDHGLNRRWHHMRRGPLHDELKELVKNRRR